MQILLGGSPQALRARLVSSGAAHAAGGNLFQVRVAFDQRAGPLEYQLYVPRRGGENARAFVSVHGISRNVDEHARLFAPFAERYGVLLIAPHFPAERFPDYQRLSRVNRGPRADEALDRALAEAHRLTGARTERIYLFGYSGGAQFAHRYTLLHPEKVARVVIGAAGWYTMPDPTQGYPAGIAPSPDLPDARFEPRRFLAVPACVLVGERDIRRGGHLRQGAKVDAREGGTRIERGRRWIEAMQSAAKSHGLNTEFRYQILPKTGHSFARSMERGNMGAAVFEFLFGKEPT